MSSSSPDLSPIAEALADAAAAQSMHYFRTPLDIITKADESPVTLADRAAETAMRQILGARVPADGIYGEEHGPERLDAGRVWVLDPIDGTRSFITGSPLWGTLIGVLEGSRVVLGMVDMPVLKERWIGQAGKGATRDGQPVRVNTANGVAQGWRMKLDSIRIGDVEVFGVEAIITSQPMPYVLRVIWNSFRKLLPSS
eukprot:gene6029-8168_t